MALLAHLTALSAFLLENQHNVTCQNDLENQTNPAQAPTAPASYFFCGSDLLKLLGKKQSSRLLLLAVATFTWSYLFQVVTNSWKVILIYFMLLFQI